MWPSGGLVVAMVATMWLRCVTGVQWRRARWQLGSLFL